MILAKNEVDIEQDLLELSVQKKKDTEDISTSVNAK
jgi:hypothetical protein